MPKRRLKTVFICRTNGPLLQAGFDLRKRCPSIKLRIIGRDIARALKETVVEILEWRRNVGIDEFNTLLESWIGEIRNKYKDKEGKEAYWAECEDKCDQIRLLSYGMKDARGVMQEIDRTFIDSDELEDDPDVVVFASGHRSKGLEWERTVIIRFDLVPHPNAETEDDLEVEEYIKYVMLTRGKEEMIVCYDKLPEPDRTKR